MKHRLFSGNMDHVTWFKIVEIVNSFLSRKRIFQHEIILWDMKRVLYNPATDSISIIRKKSRWRSFQCHSEQLLPTKKNRIPVRYQYFRVKSFQISEVYSNLLILQKFESPLNHFQISSVSALLMTKIIEFWRNITNQVKIWRSRCVFPFVGQWIIHFLVWNGHVSVTVVMNHRMASNGLGRASVMINVPVIQIRHVEDLML